MKRGFVLGLVWAVTSSGTTFHCDPEAGRMDQDGSAEQPWGSVEEVIQQGWIQRTGADGSALNPDARVKAGDTLLLRNGYHGRIRLRAGYNREFITLAAAPGHTPGVGSVTIDGGQKWRIRGLRISPSLAPSPFTKPPRHLVQLGEHGDENCSGLVVEDCFIFSTLDASDWTAEDWRDRPPSGIWLGRHGRGHVARNNYLLNLRMGIDLCAPDSLCEGNVIDGFSGDGIRVTRDAIRVQHNVIKNNYVSSADGDDNHDDGIQCFLFNKGRGLVRHVTIEENIIIQRETPGLPWINALQGIGFFDGPLEQFLVKGNVVEVDQHHGVSLYDARACRIEGNACFNPDASSRRKPWVMLGQKRNLAGGNTVVDNLAHSFNFKADVRVRAENNDPVDAASFQKRRQTAVKRIVDRFGLDHHVAGRPRLVP